MWNRMKSLWPGRAARRRLGLAGGAAGLLALAFCCGRWGAPPEVIAQTPPGDVTPVQTRSATTSGSSDYSRRAVAYIYNSIPITREELGEYLIARFGQERIEFLVNRRIIEQACQAKGITVSDAEVESQLVEDLKAMKLNLDDFVSKVLRRFNKTLFEYKEDVIRPKLALTKYCHDRIVVTQEELQKAFEAHYGAKVKCRMIILAKDLTKAKRDEIWSEVSHSPEQFDKYARSQFIQDLAAVGGEVPPIHKHFGDPRIEQVAFRLKKDEVSEEFEMPDGTTVILKCVEQLPPVTNYRLEDERLKLHKEVYDIKLTQEIPKVFQALRQQATVEIFLKKDEAQEALELRRANELLRKELGEGQAGAPGQQPGRPQQPGTLPQVGASQQPPAPGIQQTGGAMPQQPGPGVQQTGATMSQQPLPTPPAGAGGITMPPGGQR